jgi:hypothetical protein
MCRAYQEYGVQKVLKPFKILIGLLSEIDTFCLR